LVAWSCASRQAVGIVGTANNIGSQAVGLLALLAVSFMLPTVPTYAGGFFAESFGLLALLAV
jgi:hypothetical protein